MQYTDRAVAGVQAQISAQATFNATATANLSFLQTQIAQLQGMTKLVVPNASLSPGYGALAVEPIFAVEAAKLVNQTATPATTNTAAAGS